jgi:beta-aspartyl-peptidase (threonine type)
MKPGIAIHGGAGTILKSEMTPEKEQAYRDALANCMDAGYQLLADGASALDAVEAAVKALEDCELFNAGRGAVYTHEGGHEMDASIMNGKTLAAGSVAGVRNIRNPVNLVRGVMEQSEFVMLSGAGAEAFAKLKGFAFEPDSYFDTPFRYQQLLAIQHSEGMELDHSSQKKMGTVGAVALDIHGNLAAATSTGGMTNKRYHRIGDTPIIGAGTYANNNTCAISCTGHGEFFIRSVVAYDISCLMEYKGLSLAEACHEVVMNKLVKIGGEGGVIAIDHRGEIILSFNSEGMYRGARTINETPFIEIYK